MSVESHAFLGEAVASWTDGVLPEFGVTGHILTVSVCPVDRQAVTVYAKGTSHRPGFSYSDWFELGRWPADVGREVPTGGFSAYLERDVDQLRGAMGAMQWRVRVDGPVQRLDVVAYSPVEPTRGADDPGSAVQLAVPFVAQDSAGEDIGRRVCSPACVAMLLASRGVVVPLRALAAAIYDATHDVYGNWFRAVACLGAYGVPARIARMQTLAEAHGLLVAHGPLAASIAFDAGGLPGSVLADGTRGHLVVVRGFTAAGDVIVNDPADAAGGKGRVYPRAAFARAWFRHGGVAYVLV